jgi:DNA-binding transcriptional LysR family regulator
MDRFEALRIFVAVARRGSFAEAARALRLSPSVVTRSMAELERQLGLILIHRTTRALRLSEAGNTYLQSAEHILAELDAADRRVRGENAVPRGELRIAAPIVFGRLHVLPIVTRLLREHPELSIRLSLSDRNVHIVDEGIDVAIRIGVLADSSLIAVKLGTICRMCVASPSYLRDRSIPAVPADLNHHDIIAFETIDATNEWNFNGLEHPIRLQPRLFVNTADAAIAAAEADAGITRPLSYQVVGSIGAARLVPVLSAYTPPSVPVSAVYLARQMVSANVATFLAAARSHFKENPILPPGSGIQESD